MITLIILLLFIYLWAIFPNLSRKNQLKPYEQKLIAHRGFFNNQDVPENSLLAFRKAVENDYGIELDVQITTDKKLVVFHDVNLKRMTGIDKKLTDCSFAELQQYHLLDTAEKIPLFEDVLKVIHKDTPLVIEIKPEGPCIETCHDTIEMMKGYDGLYNMESFNPFVVRYLKKNAPEIIRGQLAYDMFKDNDSDASLISKFLCKNLLFNFMTRPDYIAYECNATYNLSFRIISKIYKGECVAWTCKSEADLEKAKKYYRCFIFDSFIPKKKDL